MSDQEKSAAKKGSPVLAFFVVILFFAVLAGGGAGYYFWMEFEKVKVAQHNATQAVDRQKQVIAKLESAAVQASADRQANQNALASDLNAKIESLRAQDLQLGKQLAVIQGTQQIDWMLNELEYFVKLSQRRLELTQDAQGSKALLDYADEIAQGIQEKGIVEVRRAIRTDLQKLELATDVDVDGIYLQLQSLVPLVRKMALPKKEFERDLVAISEREAQLSAEQATLPDNSWLRRIGIAFEKALLPFSGAYQFQKVDEEFEPLLGPDQRVFLQQNITLILEQAQLGLLRGENEIYQNSLAQIITWVGNYYDQSNRTVQSVNNTLAELKAVNVSPAVPNIAASIDAVVAFKEAYLESKAKRAILKTEMTAVSQADDTSEEG